MYCFLSTLTRGFRKWPDELNQMCWKNHGNESHCYQFHQIRNWCRVLAWEDFLHLCLTSHRFRADSVFIKKNKKKTTRSESHVISCSELWVVIKMMNCVCRRRRRANRWRCSTRRVKMNTVIKRKEVYFPGPGTEVLGKDTKRRILEITVSLNWWTLYFHCVL